MARRWHRTRRPPQELRRARARTDRWAPVRAPRTSLRLATQLPTGQIQCGGAQRRRTGGRVLGIGGCVLQLDRPTPPPRWRELGAVSDVVAGTSCEAAEGTRTLDLLHGNTCSDR